MDQHHIRMPIVSNPVENIDQSHVKQAITTDHGFHMKDMMMMAMTFHGGYQEQILFDSWNTTTVGAFTASWFAIFFFAVLYEGLKTFRDVLLKRDFCQACSQTENHQQPLGRILNFSHAIQTLLHIIQMAFSYLLMLIAMTYNTYLLIAIVLGAGVGHFLFAWRRSSIIDYNEHCH